VGHSLFIRAFCSVHILMTIYLSRVRFIRESGNFLVSDFIFWVCFLIRFATGNAILFLGVGNIFICYVWIYFSVLRFSCFCCQFVAWYASLGWNPHEFDGFASCKNYVLDVSGEVVFSICVCYWGNMESLRMKTLLWLEEREMAKLSAMCMVEKGESL